MFSSRLRFGKPDALSGLAPNAIAQAVSTLRSRGVALLDLTESNPTMVGLSYPPGIASALGNPAAQTYQPEPLGLQTAREAVARECSRSGVTIDPSRIVLTTSTSEAYALLFKLLCDAGDSVLVPQPSYPLFEALAGLESVRADAYRLEYHGRWSIDRDSVLAALTPRTRAVLVVSPNNPTGSILRAADRDWLATICAERGIAIVSDEVFRDYLFQPGSDASSFSGEQRALTFVLGGLSKSAGLPQMKLGWMEVSGPDPLVREALAHLEVICDTYLSVGTPVQIAAAALIGAGAEVRRAILDRITRNLASIKDLLPPSSSISLLAPEGGWTAVLRAPATESEEALVLRLLRDRHVLVHPGYFFDFATESFVIVSLLARPDVFDDGLRRVLDGVEAGVAR